MVVRYRLMVRFPSRVLEEEEERAGKLPQPAEGILLRNEAARGINALRRGGAPYGILAASGDGKRARIPFQDRGSLAREKGGPQPRRREKDQRVPSEEEVPSEGILLKHEAACGTNATPGGGAPCSVGDCCNIGAAGSARATSGRRARVPFPEKRDLAKGKGGSRSTTKEEAKKGKESLSLQLERAPVEEGTSLEDAWLRKKEEAAGLARSTGEASAGELPSRMSGRAGKATIVAPRSAVAELNERLQKAGKGQLRLVFDDQQLRVIEEFLPPNNGTWQHHRLECATRRRREVVAREMLQELPRILRIYGENQSLRERAARIWAKEAGFDLSEIRQDLLIREDQGLSLEDLIGSGDLEPPIGLDTEWAHGSLRCDLLQIGLRARHPKGRSYVALLIPEASELRPHVKALLEGNTAKVAFDWNDQDRSRVLKTHGLALRPTSYGGSGRGGTETLLANIGIVLEKDAASRRGDWAKWPLSSKLREYAAVDAILPIIYDDLLRAYRRESVGTNLGRSGSTGNLEAMSDLLKILP